ncbi:MAG: lamin tail domain-containing protein [Phycisphaerae bacterium]|nr:lamin tail domain-containing protein [Phycisphaerae bacterium]
MDLDGTDAWIEGNIFLHCHRNGAPDTAAAISGGGGGGRTSEITILGNLFFDNDNVATAKQGNFYTFINNTIVHTTKKGGVDSASGVVAIRDMIPTVTTFAKGAYLEGNIIVDAEQLVRNYDAKQTIVTLNNNILPMPWDGPGSGNVVLNPILKHIPQVSETNFANWDQAQVMRDWFSLQPGSPAWGTGPNGTDKGGVIPLGVSISGEPRDLTSRTTATLVVGVNCTGGGIPTAGFPLGSGFTHYRWRLDGATWSAETPIATPIKLTGLAAGSHHVEVIGKNDAGEYQNDPALGADAVVTVSRTWTVDPSYLRLVINEVLAVNRSEQHEGTFPGMVELYYDGAASFDLSGMYLTNEAANPAKFVFPAGSTVEPGQYLVLYADANTAASGLHLGFALKDEGDGLQLYNKLRFR